MSNGIGTTTVTQIGLVVKDMDQAIKAYCDILGLPEPNVIVTDEYSDAKTQYRGRPSYARAKLAFFNLGQVQIELIEPVGEPSTWKEALDANGYSVHHIAFQVKDTPAVVRHLSAHEIPVVQQGYYTGGMYTYVDSQKQLGVVLELLENFE